MLAQRPLSDPQAAIAIGPDERPILADSVEKLGTWAEVTLRVKHKFKICGCLESNLLVEATEGPIVSRDSYARSFSTVSAEPGHWWSVVPCPLLSHRQTNMSQSGFRGRADIVTATARHHHHPIQ